MNGIINILKPPGMTSFDVVAYSRGVLKTKKVGHTGTLDPEAVGVLPVCVGNATKAIEFITDKDKTYRAEITLGIETDTQDKTGKIISLHDVNVTKEEFEAVLKKFEGKIMQTPPMYSAVKINGKKLYELARLGRVVDRVPRAVTIFSLKCVEQVSDAKYLIDIRCSKGTYIRTLCSDIGGKLGCGAHMSFLVRLCAGPFDIDTSITLEELKDLADKGRINEKLIKTEKVFEDFNKITLDVKDHKKFLNGVLTDAPTGFKEGEIVRVYTGNNEFFAIGEIIMQSEKSKLKSKKLFIDND